MLFLQRGKSFSDGHFRYVQLKIKEAILSGGINMTDAYAFYNCLSYNGGMNHSAVVLVEVNKHVTTNTAPVCKKLMKNFKKDS